MPDDLSTADFTEFFKAVYRQPGSPGEPPRPFPWQKDLLEEVARTGAWPGLIDLPTAAGKTAAIDIAVFLMALRDDMPRRVVSVIDRRVVVDQTAEHARHLAHKLTHDSDPIIRAVARNLRSRAAPLGPPGEPPLQCAEMRGGIIHDETWALRPDVPAVLVSTVDQVGSRLLFRGYGVSPGMRPVHAGLLGNDVLFLLDEVHVAQPFAETLRALKERYRCPSALPERWQVTELSATPGSAADGRSVFCLSDKDRDFTTAPVLARRLTARKLAVKMLAESSVAHEAAKHAKSVIGTGNARVIGVVVNRVKTAHQAYGLLAGSTVFDCRLVTGRMRPLDKDAALEEIKDRICTGRTRKADDRPLVVVATQSIEVGADFDFDALVTECASLDALKQRFGRVDRDGLLSEHGTPSRSLILAAPSQVKDGALDAVYGEALARTWAALPDDEFDVSSWSPEPCNGLLAPRAASPVLLPSHLDRWVQTSPVPDADPDPSLWLHGLGRRQLDINVVWRSDITEGLLTEDSSQAVITLVSACPPGSGEAMPVPLPAARSWLASLGSAGSTIPEMDVTDLEGVPDDADDSDSTCGKPVLVWRGDKSKVIAVPSGIRPGDTIVIPSGYGGVMAGNWAPGSREPVTDLGHHVQAMQRNRAVLRLHPAVLGSDTSHLPALPLPRTVDAEEKDDPSEIHGWLAEAKEMPGASDCTRQIIQSLWDDRQRLVTRVSAEPIVKAAGLIEFFVISSKRPVQRSRTMMGDGAGTEPETSPFLGSLHPVSLAKHSHDVEKWAHGLACACGFPEPLARDIALAARLHDIGKADPRMQVMLRNGHFAGSELLAKSETPGSSRAERERARRNAGYPQGARHELLSMAMAQQSGHVAGTAADLDLVLHLIVSHHGFCRPFAPIVHDPDPPMVTTDLDGHPFSHSAATGLERIDSGVPDRFWCLVRRYGWFGLAWMETILRLADHRASAEMQVS